MASSGDSGLRQRHGPCAAFYLLCLSDMRRIGRHLMEHDLIIIGGGLAGAVLAKALAEAGADVLVLERETQFKDRVRGEAMLCWGVAEARTLGIDALLK